ncbi:hypothetical protein J5N97_026947 [Dioscorea zingiberensis]|uniref:Uncharacterized protein n=1 Tax=Dioscorea zingiberensis TaxID=325984 RepID=A0A9D5H757_9LILI|nr:hypothetical protein J5N97_026947 [Dioscorea zingiberensis]
MRLSASKSLQLLRPIASCGSLELGKKDLKSTAASSTTDKLEGFKLSCFFVEDWKLGRRHFLQCPQGLLSKHFEKLIQCDPRLYSLSQKPEIIIESPYFEPRCSVFEDPDDSKCHPFDSMDDDIKPTFSGFHKPGSPSDMPSTSNKSKPRDPSVRASDREARETPSPSSVMDAQAIEDNACSETDELKDHFRWDQLKVLTNAINAHAGFSKSLGTVHF